MAESKFWNRTGYSQNPTVFSYITLSMPYAENRDKKDPYFMGLLGR